MRISKLATCLALLGTFASAGTAHAQSTNVNVQGLIVPPACSAQFAGGADLDWGTISHNSLSDKTMTVLKSKSVTLQTQCDDGLTTHMALWAVDANPQSALTGIRVPGTNGLNGDDSTRIFGIGMDPLTNQKLGNFTMIPTTSSYDGTVNSKNYGFVRTSTHTETNFSTSSFTDNSGYETNTDHTVVDAANNPAVANTFTYSFDVYPQLNKKSAISNSQEVPFNGTAQFYVRYF
ncbi:DUF1120 domain-containing protein [Paraburkholderia sp. J12]|uniref:DUF1120 domain-containing protein n=1 Tax=Paraburkholderia sp. J12 TaxID=2805432 RepID=UPI002ABDAA1B|nr:DUF1120 domain-containing protein [Paraburkholderia sp. J12]